MHIKCKIPTSKFLYIFLHFLYAMIKKNEIPRTDKIYPTNYDKRFPLFSNN